MTTQTDRWLARDRAIFVWLQGATSNAWFVDLLAVCSRLGDGWIWYVAAAGLPWLGGATGPSASIRLIAVALVNITIYKIIKRWIARPRPSRSCPGIQERVRTLDEFSFPSGHTLHSVACTVILTTYYPPTAYVLWPFALLVAVSRIVLGVHYPSDVLVGALIGAATAAISFNLL